MSNLGSREDWDELERALRLEGTDPHRRDRLHRELRLIFLLHHLGDDVPDVRPGHIKRAFAVLRGHAEAVRAYLWFGAAGEIAPGGSFEALLDRKPERPNTPKGELGELERWAMTYFARDLLTPEKQTALLDSLEELVAAIDAANLNLPLDRGGRPPNWRLRGLIADLGRYYSDQRPDHRKPAISRHPSSGKPQGPFFRFVRSALRVFAPSEVKSDEALATDIEQALSENKVSHQVNGENPPVK